MLTPSKIIKREYKRYGFASFFVYGPQGSGKTTYSLKILKEVYGSYKDALRYLHFHLEPLIANLHAAFQAGTRYPSVIIDDAGIALLKYRWQRDAEQWFAKFYNLIRSVAGSIIFTSVEAEDIIKFVRNKVTYLVSIERMNDNISFARGYRRYLLPSGRYFVRLEFVDKFNLNIPESVRKEYENMRRAAINLLFSDFRAKPLREADLIRRAKELREVGYSWRKIANLIYHETGIKKSPTWYSRHII